MAKLEIGQQNFSGHDPPESITTGRTPDPVVLLAIVDAAKHLVETAYDILRAEGNAPGKTAESESVPSYLWLHLETWIIRIKGLFDSFRSPKGWSEETAITLCDLYKAWHGAYEYALSIAALARGETSDSSPPLGLDGLGEQRIISCPEKHLPTVLRPFVLTVESIDLEASSLDICFWNDWSLEADLHHNDVPAACFPFMDHDPDGPDTRTPSEQATIATAHRDRRTAPQGPGRTDSGRAGSWTRPPRRVRRL